MKFTSEITKFEKTVIGTHEFEIDDVNPTYLMGRSGGSSYVCAIIPEYCDKSIKDENDDWVESGDKIFLGFIIISSTKSTEYRLKLQPGELTDFRRMSSEIHTLPHGEDIINYFLNKGEGYNHQITTKKNFLQTIREWRIIK